jgi:hypothetical protein
VTEPLIEAGRQFWLLVHDTAELWWRTAWTLMTIVLLGAAARVGAEVAAVEIGVKHDHPLVAIALFPVGILVEVATLFALVRVVAVHWAARTTTAAGDDEPDPRSEPMLHALAVTLLPLIAIYSANGVIDERVRNLVNASTKETGLFGIADSPIIVVLSREWLKAVPVLVAAYVLRRVLDHFYERTGWRWLGLVTAWTELMFLLTAFIVVRRAFGDLHGWWSQRRIAHDLGSAWHTVAGWFATVRLPLPDWFSAAWGFFWHQLWPPLLDGFVLPLAWLAATALVFGYRELGGRSLIADVGVPHRVRARLDRFRGPAAPRSRGGRFALGELTDLLAGDARDKYLPTLHGLKRVLRVGPVFLGVYCLAYGAQHFLAGWSVVLGEAALGVRTPNFWIAGEHLETLALDLIWEPLRICLLAAAFIRCLRVTAAGTSAAAPARPAA